MSNLYICNIKSQSQTQMSIKKQAVKQSMTNSVFPSIAFLKLRENFKGEYVKTEKIPSTELNSPPN